MMLPPPRRLDALSTRLVPTPRPWRVVLLTLALLALGVTDSMAQDDAAVRARTLRDERRFAEAASLLRAELRRGFDPAVARLLAQTLYWMAERAEARATYEDAIRRAPSDAGLRLDYARMLAETWEHERAREVLAPVRADPSLRAYADALLGTMAYWSGDLAGARRLLRSAVAAQPDLTEARGQLLEIADITAPWTRGLYAASTDDQPLRRDERAVSAAVFPMPQLQLTVRGHQTSLVSGSLLTADVRGIEAGLSHFLYPARLQTELSGGPLQHGAVEDWTGRAQLGLRLPGHVAVRVSASRAAYLYTVASLRTPVITDDLRAVLTRSSPRGWVFEASARREMYPDENTIDGAYAYLLAPVVHGDAAQLQVGASAALQDAAQSRFVANGAPAPGQTRTDGAYDPYYTPLGLRVASAIGNASVRVGSRARLRAGGAFGMARDEAPYAFNPGTGGIQERTYPRSFRPWNARSALELSASRGLLLEIAGEASRSAFYVSRVARVQATYRFAPRALAAPTRAR